MIVLNVSFATTANDTHRDDTRIIPLPRCLITDIHAIHIPSWQACLFVWGTSLVPHLLASLAQQILAMVLGSETRH